MAIEYHVYANDYAGGPVDYTTPVATVSAPTYTPAAIPFDSDVTFAVRAFDTVSTLEERNVTVRFRLLTGPAGEDLNNVPLPPPFVSVTPYGADTLAVSWVPSKVGPTPTEYRVYAGTPTVSYAVAVETEDHLDMPAFRVLLTGLTAGSEYEVAVKAFNGSGGSVPSTVLKATPVAGTGPAAPTALTITPGWIDPD